MIYYFMLYCKWCWGMEIFIMKLNSKEVLKVGLYCEFYS